MGSSIKEIQTALSSNPDIPIFTLTERSNHLPCSRHPGQIGRRIIIKAFSLLGHIVDSSQIGQHPKSSFSIPHHSIDGLIAQTSRIRRIIRPLECVCILIEQIKPVISPYQQLFIRIFQQTMNSSEIKRRTTVVVYSFGSFIQTTQQIASCTNPDFSIDILNTVHLITIRGICFQ